MQSIEDFDPTKHHIYVNIRARSTGIILHFVELARGQTRNERLQKQF